MPPIKVKFAGAKVKTGRVPLPLLNSVTQSIQNAVFRLGEYYLEEAKVRRSGPVPKKVREACTLELVGTEKGSFMATLDLQDETMEVGKESLQSFHQITHEVKENPKRGIAANIKDPSVRFRVLQYFSEIAHETSEYTVMLGHDDQYFSLDKAVLKEAMDEYEQPTDQEVELVGKVIKLESRPLWSFVVDADEGNIKCQLLDDSRTEEILKAFDQEVIVKGEGEFTDDGQLKNLSFVKEFRVVQPGVHSIDLLTIDGRRFRMNEDVRVSIDFEDNHWHLTFEPLNIFLTDTTIKNLYKAFKEEIAFLWDEYAMEDDRYLTADAQELKEKLLGMMGEE
ncbi:hypothetical protein [Bacillus piscicola]|uniref:hypothetical protein n=1 Tax=Bacillus piscicola TaxID=1632684 RepID=UPI001F089F3B|nr:hypothetical protein [Bacillus piscicola]